MGANRMVSRSVVSRPTCSATNYTNRASSRWTHQRALACWGRESCSCRSCILLVGVRERLRRVTRPSRSVAISRVLMLVLCDIAGMPSALATDAALFAGNRSRARSTFFAKLQSSQFRQRVVARLRRPHRNRQKFLGRWCRGEFAAYRPLAAGTILAPGVGKKNKMLIKALDYAGLAPVANQSLTTDGTPCGSGVHPYSRSNESGEKKFRAGADETVHWQYSCMTARVVAKFELKKRAGRCSMPRSRGQSENSRRRRSAMKSLSALETLRPFECAVSRDWGRECSTILCSSRSPRRPPPALRNGLGSNSRPNLIGALHCVRVRFISHHGKGVETNVQHPQLKERSHAE